MEPSANKTAGSLVVRDVHGNLYEIPAARLADFKMSDDAAEKFLASSGVSGASAGPAVGAHLPAGSFVRAAPGSFVRVAPGAFVRATPGAFVRATPGAFVRAAPGAFVRASPSAVARAVPSSMVRFSPAATGFARQVPGAFVRATPVAAQPFATVIGSWVK